jgi:peptidoglycan/LPS O-acetylase OafA/YrhL
VTGQAVPSRVHAIDGFRAYAILGVVTFHLLGLAGALQAGTTTTLITWGVLGNIIDAFFIVSGFVLFLAVVRRGGELGSLRSFAAGRGARLVPPYWITLAVMLALLALVAAPPVGPGVQAHGLPSFPNLVVHLAGLQMPARMIDSNVLIGFGINGALWMVSVIVCFYLVFPLIAKPYYRHPLIGLAAAAAITIAWKEGIEHLPGVLAAIDLGSQPRWIEELAAIDQLPGWAFSFALGMTAAWGYRRLYRLDPARTRRAAAWALPVSLVACGVCAYFYGKHASAVSGPAAGSLTRTDTFLTMAYTFSRAALMAAIVLGPLWVRAPFDTPRVRGLAGLSYSVYLIHLVIAIYLGEMLLSLPADGSAGAVVLWIGLVLPASLVYALFMRRYVERPSRAWASRASAGGSRAAAMTAASPGSAPPTGSRVPRPASST